MRDIKFRAWVTSEKTMIQHREVVERAHLQFNDSFNQSDIVMQYTGLKDKYGNEIFEGDLVDYGNNRFMPVEFINGCFCICKNTAMPTLMTLFPVIGNIHENPELL